MKPQYWINSKNISEHIGLADMTARTTSFRTFLASRNENCIVVVGHSAFFRQLLGTEKKMSNCEIESWMFEANEAGNFHFTSATPLPLLVGEAEGALACSTSGDVV